jgi:type I restriction enzyme S subunit
MVLRPNVSVQTENTRHSDTEIGRLPADWAVITLEEITETNAPIRYGVVQIGPNSPGGVPIVPIKHIHRIGNATLHQTSPEIERKYSGSRVTGGDILISVKGTIGEVGVVPDGFEGNIAREIARIRPRSGFDIDFISFQLEAPETQRRISALVVGSTRLEFSIHAVRGFPMAVPPLPEQQKIAEILSTWDKAIETAEALLANARTQKRALMQSLLTGTRRFPGFEGHPWREVRLADVCKIRKGEQKSKNTLDADGRFPVINGGVAPSGYTDEWNAKAGTITISEGGNSCGFANLIDVPFWSGGHCYTLEDLQIERDYLFFWLKFREAEIMRLRVGSGLPNIQKKAITNFPVITPSTEEQARVVDVISFAFQEEKAIEFNLDHLRTEKISLMQQLLTGKRRVVV